MWYSGCHMNWFYFADDTGSDDSATDAEDNDREADDDEMSSERWNERIR